MAAQKPPQTDDSPDGGFFSAFWKAALAVGGLGTVGSFVFWDLYKSLFQQIVGAQLLSRVGETYSFILMLTPMLLIFVFATWVVTLHFRHAQKKRSR